MVHAQLGGERVGVESCGGFEEQAVGFRGEPKPVLGGSGDDCPREVQRATTTR